jgi:hypothetical protein
MQIQTEKAYIIKHNWSKDDWFEDNWLRIRKNSLKTG